MKVILKEEIKKLEKMGQIVDVADGYARNYFVPRGLAVEANTKNIRSMEHAKDYSGKVQEAEGFSPGFCIQNLLHDTYDQGEGR